MTNEDEHRQALKRHDRAIKRLDRLYAMAQAGMRELRALTRRDRRKSARRRKTRNR